MSGNEFLPNYVEHIVPLKETKLLLPKKLGILSLAFLLAVIGIALAVTVLKTFAAALVPVFLILVMFLVWYLWRFVSVEFEYTILQGEMKFDVVYGRRQRKHYYTMPLNRVEKMVPLSSSPSFLNSVTAEKEIFCASKKENPFTWCALVREENSSVTLVYFEMTTKAEKVLRFYNSRAFLGA